MKRPFELHHGNCLDVLPALGSGAFKLAVCDLPYGKTALAWDRLLPMEWMWKELWRTVDGPVVHTAAQPFTSMLVRSDLANFRYALVWDKGKGSNPLLSGKRPMSSHEDVLVFYERQPPYFPQMTEGAPYAVPRTGGNRTNSLIGARGDRPGFRQSTKDTSKRFPTSVLKFSIHCGSKRHPSEKPVGLAEWLIRTYTKSGDRVLDPTMGSGTVGVACANTGRRFCGIESDEGYYTQAKRRIEEAFADKKKA